MASVFQLLDSFPDLLSQATDEVQQDTSPYARQDALLEEARTRQVRFKWTMPLRHRYRCSTGQHEAGEAILRFGAPDAAGRLREAEVHASVLHEVIHHSQAPDATLAALLELLPRA